jgi:3-oxoacyl-[acyl-carrier protein] reductase
VTAKAATHRRVAIVLGATSGIGKAIARRLADAETAVAVHCHRDRAAATALCDELDREGAGATVVQADVAAFAEVRDMAAAVAGELGVATIVVNAAARVRFERLMDSDPDDWTEQIDVTLRGALNVCRVFGEGMIEAGRGRFVHIVAEGALLGEPSLAVASVVKAGVLGLTRTAALELASHGVTVNSVSPGFVVTAATPERYRDPERLAALTRRYPMGRLGTPDDVAAAVGFLCSDAAGYITGQTISVSGGFSTR